MAYILAEQRDGDPGRAERLWHEYQAYLQEHRSTFPSGAYALATSDWYFGFSDHRAPHDAWLESFQLEEVGTGERGEERHLSLRVRLLGAFHDRILEFFYPEVFAYEIQKPRGYSGHFDWRYDEFRLGTGGTLIHEIEWAGGPKHDAKWVIEASDVEFKEYARGDAV